jgi:hypothetical protein
MFHACNKIIFTGSEVSNTAANFRVAGDELKYQ